MTSVCPGGLDPGLDPIYVCLFRPLLQLSFFFFNEEDILLDHVLSV